MKSILALTWVFLIASELSAQTYGCTDSQANNYNPSASINDGSCLYDQTSYAPLEIISGLPTAVDENSGLIYFNGSVWTHNDGGWPAAIYKLDLQTGDILQTVTINSVANTDWEELAQDDSSIYIGDFGSNYGDRTDLNILKIAKSDIPSTGDVTVGASKIEFSYPDQSDFTPDKFNHDYDCEAMISIGDSLYLFSKNWVNRKTRLYSVSKKPGSYIATLIDSYNVDGLITGAAINSSDSTICLIGHDNVDPFVSFVWLLFDYPGTNLLSGNKRRIGLTGLDGYQTEAICFKQDNKYYISNEDNTASSPNLYEFSTDQWITLVRDETRESFRNVVHPNPSSGIFMLDIYPIQNIKQIKVVTITGQAVYTANVINTNSSGKFMIDLHDLDPGIFLLQVFDQKGSFSINKIIIN